MTRPSPEVVHQLLANQERQLADRAEARRLYEDAERRLQADPVMYHRASMAAGVVVAQLALYSESYGAARHAAGLALLLAEQQPLRPDERPAERVLAGTLQQLQMHRPRLLDDQAAADTASLLVGALRAAGWELTRTEPSPAEVVPTLQVGEMVEVLRRERVEVAEVDAAGKRYPWLGDGTDPDLVSVRRLPRGGDGG